MPCRCCARSLCCTRLPNCTSIASAHHLSLGCRGGNSNGQLALGNNVDTNHPTVPSDFPDDVVDVQVGDNFVCVLTSTGDVYCVGDGANGRTGHGSTNDTNSATGAGRSPVGGPASSLSVGPQHTCVIRQDGGVVWCVVIVVAPRCNTAACRQLTTAHSILQPFLSSLRSFGSNDDGALGYGMPGEDVGDDG